MKLSVIVPCFNEEKNIRPFYERTVSCLDGTISDYELVFVNDGSEDATLKNLKEITLESSVPVKVISFSRNFGKEAAIYAGLLEASGDLITLIDADLQQDPAFVVDMVNTLDSHPEYDCVAAFQEKRNESKLNIFFKNNFYRLINKISDTDFVNGASDFRTFRAQMKDAILKMSEYHRFSKGIFSWVGFNTFYMPYTANDRLSGTSKWSFFKLCKYAIEGIIAFTTTPLRISSVVGFLTSVLSIIYLIVVVIQKLAFSIMVPGYATIVVLILLLGGLQLTALGIIGEYLARTYIQSKDRPIYIVREKFDNSK